MKEITISVDAMGGSNAPEAVVKAVSLCLKQQSNVNFLLFGNKEKIRQELKKHDLNNSRIILHNSEDVISDHAEPIEAMRNGSKSSMKGAIEAVKNKHADACVSGGNTGALMVMSKMRLGCLATIKRPAIIGTFPTMNGRSVVLDLGANTEVNEEVLFQFALMGLCFAKGILQKSNPSLAILNIGSEDIKGRSLEKKTSDLLKIANLNFTGYVEGHDLVKGKADVIVTDGFSGNIILKTAEGTANMFLEIIKKSCKNSGLLAKLGSLLLNSTLKKNLKVFDPSLNNGAMFVGINGIVVKSHGSSNAIGIKNALDVAIQLVHHKVNQQILNELLNLEKKGIYLNIVDKIKHKSAQILGISSSNQNRN